MVACNATQEHKYALNVIEETSSLWSRIANDVSNNEFQVNEKLENQAY